VALVVPRAGEWGNAFYERYTHASEQFPVELRKFGFGTAPPIDISGAAAEVGVAVGGNAVILADRDGFALDLAVPSPAAPAVEWQHLFEGARLRAERSLAQPVTHAVLVLQSAPDTATAARLLTAGEAAGLTLLQFVARDTRATAEPPALGAAILAEDMAPRPEAP
jgi:hypothetical protein